MNPKAEKLALFRYGIIAQLVIEALPRGELTRRAEQIAARQYDIPDSRRRDLSVDTLLEWAKRYRRGGLEALAPKPKAPANGNPDRIERVARALCQADGRDPDRAIETGQWETVVSGGLQTRRPVTLRGWKVYEKNARQFLAALDAAQDSP